MLLTENEIIAKYDDLKLFEHYTSIKMDSYGTTNESSPFKDTNNHSFSVFLPYGDKKHYNRYFFKDYSLNISGDIFQLVANLYNISRREAINKIAMDIFRNDFNDFTISKREVERESRDTKISIQSKPFTKEGLNYWAKWNITEEILNKYKVKEVALFTINDLIIHGKLSFSFEILGKYKILNSGCKDRFKWMSNFDRKCIEGLYQLKYINTSQLVITKALKECMFYHSLGIAAISPRSENTPLPKEVIDYLRKKYSDIIVYFDNDTAGKLGAEVYKQYGFRTVFNKTHKNVTDELEESNLESVINNLCQLGIKSLVQMPNLKS